MIGRPAAAGILLRIALRDLVASRAKTAVVGGIVLFAAALAVAGGAVVEAMDRGMAAAVQGSLSGQLQLQDARSRDVVALYGGTLGEPDLLPFEDFARVKAAVTAVPGVKAVVPMGVGEASLLVPSAFDVALEELRADVRAREVGGGPELAARETAHRARARRMVALLQAERAGPGGLDGAAAEDPDQVAALAQAASDPFWKGYPRDPLGALELLENRVAPLAASSAALPVRYVGTDLEAFRRAFERLEVVEGQLVPPGARGLLVGKRYAEEWLKLKTARRLDQIHDALQRHRRLAGDPELARAAADARRQAREILLQLDPLQAEEAGRRLRRALGSAEPDLTRLLDALLTVDDATFEARYRIFYGELAPLLRLYAVRPGDTVTLQAASRSGYTRAVNVKVWGFVQFRGLESSTFAAAASLLDLLSFRELYGWLTPERAAEIHALQEASGTGGLSREEAEAALFGPGSAVVEEGRSARIAEPAPPPRHVARPAAPATQEELDRGVAPHAAVILDDPSRSAEAALAIEAAGRRAGLSLRAVSWQEASGAVGEFVAVARLVLWAAVAVVLAVALVIVSNALVIATLQRVSEIGTLRAIGAQRGFVRALVVGEALAVGLVFGGAGAGLGALLVAAVRAMGGIPAASDELAFVFSGPALVPVLSRGSVAVALLAVLTVTAGAALYPALLATRVSPLAAMQTDD
ncbi:ABC transporter permease [Anaeromyxobacter diazotrophicus]|uniref:ABC3 transporter permease C-terminal domain-containing protein n=1 Tax=Anaeromyxobacter diazotrophicus TaxID=2590199 RepID=A0A7I9VNT9_9BACT|nr:ABC transporter permease [Anaeromyxobacter diazotrophicus]GEJ57779.1 hypothetical protein AMYX_25200 [Anaeromyxobacter diazotrophicus]